ncbi:MAG: hypothetical protein ACW99F_02185 [Candidatus Hodarchaeales archaeon]
MTEDIEVNIRNKIVYGAIAGIVGGAVDVILKFLVSVFNIGKFDDIDFVSQQFLSTTAGNPNVVGVFIIGIVSWAFVGLVYGIILYLLMTRARWERNLSRYIVVAFLIGFGLTLLTMTYLPLGEWDLIVDLPIQFTIGVGSMMLLAPIVYYLEERFG